MGTFVRRYVFIAYWLMFAVHTLHQAQYPGLMLNKEEWRYPWKAVIAVWVLLAALIGILHLILRPMSFHRSWGRLLAALSFSALLLTAGIASVVTDMPGYYYVLAHFSLVTIVGMLLFTIVQVAIAIWEQFKHA